VFFVEVRRNWHLYGINIYSLSKKGIRKTYEFDKIARVKQRITKKRKTKELVSSMKQEKI
jgi:hypothetical protein